MMSIWKTLAPRERLLLVLAAAVAVIATVIQFGLIPLLERREAAKLNLAQSSGTLVRLQKLSEASATYLPAVAPRPFLDSIAMASQWATESGMTYQQENLTPTEARFVLTPVDPTTVFAWLERIENELGISTNSAELTSSERGLVQATIVFSESQTP